jgi:hypothetical protein
MRKETLFSKDTPLYSDSLRTINEVLRRADAASLNPMDQRNITPLQFAAVVGHPNAVRMLAEVSDSERANCEPTAVSDHSDPGKHSREACLSTEVRHRLRKLPSARARVRAIRNHKAVKVIMVLSLVCARLHPNEEQLSHVAGRTLHAIVTDTRWN